MRVPFLTILVGIDPKTWAFRAAAARLRTGEQSPRTCSPLKVPQIHLLPCNLNNIAQLAPTIREDARDFACLPSGFVRCESVTCRRHPWLFFKIEETLRTLRTHEQKSPDWTTIQAACRNANELDRLTLARKVGWTPFEFIEYARCCFRRKNKDYATSHSYREALRRFESNDARQWLKCFRHMGPRPLPPREAAELSYTPGENGICVEDRYWPWHSPALVALIETRARNFFRIPDTFSVHPNAWRSAHRWYVSEVRNSQKATAK